MTSDATHGLPDISAIVEREQPPQIVYMVMQDTSDFESSSEVVYVASTEAKARKWIHDQAPIGSAPSVTAWVLDI